MFALLHRILILIDCKSTARMDGNHILINIVEYKCEIGYGSIAHILLRIHYKLAILGDGAMDGGHQWLHRQATVQKS